MESSPPGRGFSFAANLTRNENWHRLRLDLVSERALSRAARRKGRDEDRDAPAFASNTLGLGSDLCALRNSLCHLRVLGSRTEISDRSQLSWVSRSNRYGLSSQLRRWQSPSS